jgi:hypothetical protein
MRAFKSVRFWVLGLIAVCVLGVLLATVVAALGVLQAPNLSLDQRIAAEGVVGAEASFLVAVIAAIVALAAFALASERPSLRIWTRINDDHHAPDHTVIQREALVDRRKGRNFDLKEFHWDDLGPDLWIRVYNDAGFSARNPAVRVEASGFEVSKTIVGRTQYGWREAEPLRDPNAVAWTWDGGDRAIHGPKWFRALPSLKIKGLRPPAELPQKNPVPTIRIEAVAEGGRTLQTITFNQGPSSGALNTLRKIPAWAMERLKSLERAARDIPYRR